MLPTSFSFTAPACVFRLLVSAASLSSVCRILPPFSSDRPPSPFAYDCSRLPVFSSIPVKSVRFFSFFLPTPPIYDAVSTLSLSLFSPALPSPPARAALSSLIPPSSVSAATSIFRAVPRISASCSLSIFRLLHVTRLPLILVGVASPKLFVAPSSAASQPPPSSSLFLVLSVSVMPRLAVFEAIVVPLSSSRVRSSELRPIPVPSLHPSPAAPIAT